MTYDHHYYLTNRNRMFFRTDDKYMFRLVFHSQILSLSRLCFIAGFLSWVTWRAVPVKQILSFCGEAKFARGFVWIILSTVLITCGRVRSDFRVQQCSVRRYSYCRLFFSLVFCIYLHTLRYQVLLVSINSNRTDVPSGSLALPFWGTLVYIRLLVGSVWLNPKFLV